MAIHEFTFDHELTQRFVRFGYQVYRGDRHWVPPLEDDVFSQLAPEFPFYGRPGNAHRHFLATAGGRVRGRISATVNRDLKDCEGMPVGCLGFFESENDPTVAQDLLDAAVGWLRREHGLSRVWGPMNFDIWHGYRFLTSGFGDQPFSGEPYNKPYYPQFFERYGFVPKRRWNSYEAESWDSCEHLRRRGATRLHEFVRSGYRFLPFNHSRFREELRKLHAIVLRSYAQFPGFTPISFAEFEQVTAPMRHTLLSRSFIFVHDAEHEVCGFAAALLDVSDALRAMQGRSTPIARAKFLIHRQFANRVMFHLIGLTPEEARKRNGLGTALVTQVLNGLADRGYQRFIASLMAEGNASRGLLHGLAGDKVREYVLYELNQ